ncbi:hypothetical protein PV08_08808 [Exophiala spinifera]|uniref:DNA endonuclease activator Ctp1 C-terminal domain-containing protein n=1 Tax=Exophiala spinifera TaxID=91928 RepID=A0A0D1ZLC5_9EURO|nr:uncharacterized protein PV08_08808 [Exophiala spinifera]KIW13617.1 hypothetical protein PV08_08808 [Exophiala spinifera]
MDASPQTLTSTLILALHQSELLLRQLDESNKTIERLGSENERIKLELDQLRSQKSGSSNNSPDQQLMDENEQLKKDLSDLRNAQHNVPVPCTRLDEALAQETEQLKEEVQESRRKLEQFSDMTAQFEQLFRKDVERQAEIDQLKSKLRVLQAKERKWRLSNTSVSSPIISSDEADANANTTSPGTTKRKRPRSRSPEVLKEITGNVPTGSSAKISTSTTRPKFKRHSDQGVDAIPAVAEDGEDYRNKQQSDGGQGQREKPKESTEGIPSKHRLKALLTTPAANPSLLLLRPEGASTSASNKSRGTPSAEHHQQQPKSHGSTPFEEATATATTPTPTTPTLTPSKPAATTTTTTAAAAAATMATTTLANASKPTASTSSSSSTATTTSVRKPPFLPPKSSRHVLGPEDDEPFRSRPLGRLNLTHFKINTAYTGGVDYAYDEVVRGHARRCLPGCTRPECCGHKFRVLADTLPAAADELSDDALLLDFLGPGSEARIADLTAIARANLLHEARAKRLANLYGRAHRETFERARSPPGFWNTEFPSTQEDKENREQSRQREREEVERRYHDAKRGGGRWLFADE